MQTFSTEILTKTVLDCGLFVGRKDDYGIVPCHNRTRYLINEMPFIVECKLHNRAVQVYVAGEKIDRLGFFGVPSVYSVYDVANLERILKAVKKMTVCTGFNW